MVQQAKHDFKKNINKKKRASSYKRASSFWLFVLLLADILLDSLHTACDACLCF